MAINKNQILEQTLAAIKKEMPDEVIDRYREFGNSVEVKTLSTGSLAADSVLGGGFPVGRISCLVGHTSSGKTTLALTACAELQRNNPDANILYVDSECSIDPRYAESLGVNMQGNFVLIQPNNGENGYKAAEMFINSGVADMVIIDSVAAMIPKAMFEVELGDQAQIGMGARLDSQGIARLFGPAHKNNTTVILINQWKKAVKVNSFDRTDGISGNYYMPGGETIKFYFSQLIEVQRVGKIYEKDENGVDQLATHQTRARVLKNKIAPPGREADFFITFGIGVDKVQETIELGFQFGFINRSGQMWSIIEGKDENGDPVFGKAFRGRPAFVKYLRENPEIVEKIREKISKKINSHKDNVTIDKESDEETTLVAENLDHLID